MMIRGCRAVTRVEGEAERVAQSVAEDLRLGAANGGGRARVDAQELAEPALLVLSVVWRIATRAAVAGAEIEQVAEELQLAAVVIRVGPVGYLDHRAAGAPRGSRRAPALELVDPDVPIGIGVVDVEATAFLVVGGEGDREQAALAAEGDQAADVEERLAELAAVAQDAHLARLLDDEEQLRKAGRTG